MNTQRMKFGCLRGAPILTALLTIAVLLSTPQARASIDMTLNLDRQNDAFSPSLSLYASGASDPVTYHRVESPNAIFYRTVGSQNTSSYVNQTYSAMISECTAGLWTLTTNVGDPSEEVYSFSVSITGLSEGLFGDTSVTNPGSFEVVSTNQPLIEWTSTSLFPEIHIQVHNGVQPPEPGNFYTAPAPFNSWTPPSPVLGGTNYIYLAYQTNDFAGITISTPTNGGGGTVSNWTATADLSSYDFSAFVVPGICTDPFNIAVECPGFSWYTDEYEPWIVSTADYTVGPSSLQSTADTNGYSYLEATVQGPATVTFDWALFGSYGDYIEFYSYDNETGTDEDFFYYEGYESFGWDTYTVTLSSNATYTLSWSFGNDETNDFGLDSAFLDNVIYNGSGTNSVSHAAEFELEIERVTSGSSTYYVMLPRLNNVDPVSSLDEVESPTGYSSGTETTSSSIHFSTLQDVINEIEAGPWTIYFDRNGASYEYDFTVTVNALSSNDLAAVLITLPLDGATGVATNTTFAWTGPSGWDSLFAHVWNVEASSTVASSSLPPATTNWTPSTALPPATNSFSVSYSDFGFTGLSFSLPNNGAQSLSGWSTSASLGSRGTAEFVVSGFTPLPVSILSPAIVGDAFVLSFLTQSGATHFVEWRTNLVTGSWWPATNFPGDGTTHMISLPTTNAAAFFRVNTQ